MVQSKVQLSLEQALVLLSGGPAGVSEWNEYFAARADFGPAELVLVRPQRPSLLIHPDFEQMAHGAEEHAREVRVVDRLEEALAMWRRRFEGDPGNRHRVRRGTGTGRW